MRVLVISQYFPPDAGGGSKRASNAIKGLVERGHHIEVITAFPHYPHGNVPLEYRGKLFAYDTWRNMRIIRVFIPAIAHAGFLRRLILYISFSLSAMTVIPLIGSIDVIWAANPNVFSSLPALVYAFLKRAPIIRNVDDLWPETAIEEGYLTNGVLGKIGKLVTKAAYRLCSALTPISFGYKKIIAKKYGIAPDKIHVVEVGVDLNSLYLPDESCSDIDEFIVMYSGIFGTGYNFDYIFDVANLLKTEKTIRFVIRGFGERAKELRKKIVKRGLHNIELSTSFVPFDQLMKLLNTADVFFLPMVPLPAHDAGLPTKLFEYMASGKPVICSSSGEASKLVIKSKCGFTVSPLKPQEAVEAILNLRRDKSLRLTMGKNGKAYVEKYLSTEKISKKMEEVFSSVLEK